MPSNHANKITGRLGEDIACNFLEKLGYKILAKNYRYSRFAEIDIVAKDKDTIVFTEALLPAKQQRVLQKIQN